MMITVTRTCLSNVSPCCMPWLPMQPGTGRQMNTSTSVEEVYRDCGCARARRGDGRLYERGAPLCAFKARGRCRQPGVLAYAIGNVRCSLWQARLPCTSTLACRDCCGLQEIFDMARSLKLLPVLAPASLSPQVVVSWHFQSLYNFKLSTKRHCDTLSRFCVARATHPSTCRAHLLAHLDSDCAMSASLQRAITGQTADFSGHTASQVR